MTSGESRAAKLYAFLVGTLMLAGLLPAARARADNALLPPPPPIPVDAYNVQGKLAETAEFDSNPLLQPGVVKSLYGSVTTPEVILGATFPGLAVDDDTRVNVNRFNQGNLSSDDIHSLSHASWRGETWQIGVTANADSDTTRTSEVTASGLNIAGLRHEGYTVTPMAIWLPDEIDSLQISAFQTSSFYQTNPIYRDYRIYGVTPSYQHSFDEKNSALFQVQLNHFETLNGVQTKVDQLQPAVGWGTTLTPQLTIVANVGLQRTFWNINDNLRGTTPATTGLAFAIDVGYAGEQDTLHVTSSRQPNPTAIGTEIETTQLTVLNKFLITPRLEFDMNLTYQKSDYGPFVVSYQKNYVSGNPSFVYHVTDRFDMSLGYQYRQQALYSTTEVPVSDVVMFTVTYSSSALAIR